MNRWIFAAAGLLCLVPPAFSQAVRNAPDVREFVLTPAAPPEPILKYHLLYGYAERRPGNAAIKYLTATQLIGSPLQTQVFDASDALDAKKAGFHDLARKLDAPGILGLLDLGAHCDHCDWEVPVREQGINALLPYLNASRLMAQLLRVHAVMLAEDGDFDQSLSTIRNGYELARNIGHAPILIDGLVGVGIAQLMNDAMADVMNQPESPNLYWALASLPHPFALIGTNFDGELAFMTGSVPELNRKNLNSISADEWHGILNQLSVIAGPPNTPADQAAAEISAAAAKEIPRDLPAASQYYSRAFGISADDVSRLDSTKVVCTYWYQEYLNLIDEQQAPTSMPYPKLIDCLGKLDAEIRQLQKDQPANLFIRIISSSQQRAAISYARLDRMIAALTDVEAVRSYAAAHNGALPARLEDITDTPALDNPLDGKPFVYQVNGDTATLSEATPSDVPLTYTIRIRK